MEELRSARSRWLAHMLGGAGAAGEDGGADGPDSAWQPGTVSATLLVRAQRLPRPGDRGGMRASGRRAAARAGGAVGGGEEALTRALEASARWRLEAGEEAARHPGRERGQTAAARFFPPVLVAHRVGVATAGAECECGRVLR